MPINPAFQRLRQENSEFETSLGYITRVFSVKGGNERETEREGG
jgi:hypothetical protein